MYEIKIVVCEQQEVEDILEALSNAEEEGVINFPFQTSTKQFSSEKERLWKHNTLERIKRFREQS